MKANFLMFVTIEKEEGSIYFQIIDLAALFPFVTEQEQLTCND